VTPQTLWVEDEIIGADTFNDRLLAAATSRRKAFFVLRLYVDGSVRRIEINQNASMRSLPGSTVDRCAKSKPSH